MTSLTPYLQYFSEFDKLSMKPSEIKHFADGTLFHELISLIEDMPIVGINQQPQSFPQIFANWKNIYKCLEQFWKDILAEEITCEQIDFVELSHNCKEEQLIKLGQLFIKSAVKAPNKQFFIEKILTTSQTTQQYFMNIVKNTFQDSPGDSPTRKEKEKKLYDKLIQLMHQNDKLLQFISIIDNQRIEAQKKNQQLLTTLDSKQKEIKKMAATMSQLNQTPKKYKIMDNVQGNDKNSELVDKLKNKMVEMVKNHEKELARKRQELEFFTSKFERITELQSIIENNQEKVADAERAISKVNQLQNVIRNYMVQIQQKKNQISIITNKLQKSQQKIMELEEKEVQYRLQIERKNVQLEEKISRGNKNADTEFAYSTPLTMQKTLSEQCPEIINNQTENLFETNRMLRGELERNMKILRQRDSEIQKYKTQLQNLEQLEQQNKKMSEIIKKLTNNRGQQNDLLVGCIYQLRMQTGIKTLKQPKKFNSVGKKVLGDILMN